jgi:Zn-finger nucleic acid-binding protein
MGTAAIPSTRSSPGRARRSCLECRVPLKQRYREGVEIDFCPTCLSVWLDRGEFERLVDRMRGPEVDPFLYWSGFDVSVDAMRRAEYVA